MAIVCREPCLRGLEQLSASILGFVRVLSTPLILFMSVLLRRLQPLLLLLLPPLLLPHHVEIPSSTFLLFDIMAPCLGKSTMSGTFNYLDHNLGKPTSFKGLVVRSYKGWYRIYREVLR